MGGMATLGVAIATVVRKIRPCTVLVRTGLYTHTYQEKRIIVWAGRARPSQSLLSLWRKSIKLYIHARWLHLYCKTGTMNYDVMGTVPAWEHGRLSSLPHHQPPGKDLLLLPTSYPPTHTFNNWVINILPKI